MDQSRWLDRLKEPQDLAELSPSAIEAVAEEVRERLMEVVNVRGGHLASNLGIVELTIALHRVFDFRRDRVVFDVSHQTYPHKILTGRNDLFGDLRQYKGCCGFASKDESPFDLFDAGHAGTSISAALGLAVADRALGRRTKSIAVVGDASIACGMAFEAMNHGGDIESDLIVVLNDNRMSIDRSVGALSKTLNRIRTGKTYRGFKRDMQVLLPRIPWVGKPFEEALESVHEIVHNAFVPGLFFEELGFRYFGPFDGHDVPELETVLERAKTMRGPVLLHVLTEKGRGYAPAQADPIKYHASKGFLNSEGSKEPPTVRPAATPKTRTFSEVFRDAVVDLGAKRPDVRTITAAMPGGTGLAAFQEEFPDRYDDVGIAEQHGVTYSSGLARGGLTPIFAVYSTFLQRGYDQVIHDVCLQSNRVIFALDRAGLVEDGPTHHGVFDISFLRPVPNLSLAAPADEHELREMLDLATQRDGSSAIRYAKITVPELSRREKRAPVRWGRGEVLRPARAITVLAYGSMVPIALDAADKLEDSLGLEVGVVNMRFAKPVDRALLRELEDPNRTIVTLEEHVIAGGFGSAVLEEIADQGLRFAQVQRWGVPDQFVSFGHRDKLLAELGIDADGVASRLVELAGVSSSI